MSDSTTGNFSIKGAPETFVSTMMFLFADRKDLVVSPDYDRRDAVRVTPSGPQPYFRFCRLEAYALQEGPTQIRYFAPSKGDMEDIIEDVKATLKQRGFIIDDKNEPAAATVAPQPDDQAGEPPRPGDDGATWDDTFDWYHRVPRSVCGSLRDLAKMIGWGYGTVKNKHANYMAEHSDQKSLRE